MPIVHRDSDYAIRSLLELAEADDVVSVSDLATVCDVPTDFLRKIMQKLQRADLVYSVQGPTGGYGLEVAPEDLSLWQIMRVVQGPVVVNACFEDPDICCNVPECPVRGKLSELQDTVSDWLKGLTLADLVEKAEATQ